ncbi:MAG: tRNA dihydrouridine synthase DusB [Planctomycetota bacterium]|nr:MAG: tRNA dihydrouridine synthase DusB [Planctomycetota bacterium]
MLNNKHRLFLAPMSGITDTSFRLLMRGLGVDIVISELLSAESIVNSHKRTLSMLNIDKKESPIGIQLFGSDPNVIRNAAIICKDYGAEFIDINMGCPKRKINKKKSGAALLKDPQYLKDFLTIINENLTLPLSIKIRTGWDTKNADEIIQIAHETGVSFVSIHGRTQSQGYDGKSDWDYINKIASISNIPIIGNGDILYANEATNILKNTSCHGIMIGRGALLNPLIFLEINQLLNNKKIDINLIDIIKKYYEIVLQKIDIKVQGIKLAKIYFWFSLRYENAETFKKDIFTLKDSPQKIIEYTLNHFNSNLPLTQQTSPNFLMGGHG